MSKIVWHHISAAVLLALLSAAPVWGQPSLTNSGYKENFDSMGPDGTSPPDGWTLYTIPGTSLTWVTSIPADQMSPELFGRLTSDLTLVLFFPNSQVPANNNGLNAADSDTPDDRALATVPTSIAGNVIELVLTNNTGGPMVALSIFYDIRRFQVGAGGPAELPGYWLFYSLDGGLTYTNVSQLNPDGRNLPNTVGVTHIEGQFNLSKPLSDGERIHLCWVDDNDSLSSPDEIIGLDNVGIGAAATVVHQSIGIRFFGSGGPPDSPAMDASEVAGVVPQANWNQENGSANFNVGPLRDNNGLAVTGTVLNYASNNTWNTGIPDAPGDSRLMGAYLDTNTIDYTVVIIEGLSHLTTSNGSYDVYLYITGGVHTERRHGFYSIDGGSGLVTKECTDVAAFDPAVGYIEDKQDGKGGNYLHFAGVSGGTLVILANAQNPNDPTDNGFRAPLNAIQIVAN